MENKQAKEELEALKESKAKVALQLNKSSLDSVMAAMEVRIILVGKVHTCIVCNTV